MQEVSTVVLKHRLRINIAAQMIHRLTQSTFTFIGFNLTAVSR